VSTTIFVQFRVSYRITGNLLQIKTFVAKLITYRELQGNFLCVLLYVHHTESLIKLKP
jgi:hypothetical protein